MKIAFLKGQTDFVSKEIESITDSNYTHCFLILSQDIQGDSLILESASHGGVKFNLLSTYKDRPVDIFKLNLDYNDISSLKKYIGDSYGYLNVIGFAISKWLGLKSNILTGGVICSELVSIWLINSPVWQEFNSINILFVSPGDLYSIISKSSNFIKIN